MSTRNQSESAMMPSSSARPRPVQVEPPRCVLITWATYGTWLPCHNREWERVKQLELEPPNAGFNPSDPEPDEDAPILLNRRQRRAVEFEVRNHILLRRWKLHALAVQSDQIHVAVTVASSPRRVRDQLKANATRVLRQLTPPINARNVWTQGGDITLIESQRVLDRFVKQILTESD